MIIRRWDVLFVIAFAPRTKPDCMLSEFSVERHVVENVRNMNDSIIYIMLFPVFVPFCRTFKQTRKQSSVKLVCKGSFLGPAHKIMIWRVQDINEFVNIRKLT